MNYSPFFCEAFSKMAVTRIAVIGLLAIAANSPQQSHRKDISRFGTVALAPQQRLTVKVTAAKAGQGCQVRLVYLRPTGSSAQRSFTATLAPGTSISDSLVEKPAGNGELIRVAAWTNLNQKPEDCQLSATVSDALGIHDRALIPDDSCTEGQCAGVTAGELKSGRLRLYASAPDGASCHAEMGFRLPHGIVSSSAKYASLADDRGEELEWQAGIDDALEPGDTVVPEVAYHPGDRCIVSAEVYPNGAPGLTRQAPVLLYASPAIGLAMDPASLRDSEKVLAQKLAEDPKDVWVIEALANAYDRDHQRDVAAALLEGAVKIKPRFAELWFLLAKVRYEKQDYEGSMEAMHSYLLLHPGDPRGTAVYGAALARAGHLKKAENVLLPLLDSPSTRTPSVLDAVGELFTLEAKYADALPLVDEAEVRHPSCPTTLQLKAQVLFGLGKLDESTRIAQRVVDMDPSDAQSRLLLITLYQRQGKSREAAEQAAILHAAFTKQDAKKCAHGSCA